MSEIPESHTEPIGGEGEPTQVAKPVTTNPNDIRLEMLKPFHVTFILLLLGFHESNLIPGRQLKSLIRVLLKTATLPDAEMRARLVDRLGRVV